MTTKRPCWQYLEPELRKRQPSGTLPSPGPKGWIDNLYSPLRTESTPSFCVKPDDNGGPGGFIDHGSGEKGSLVALIQRLGITVPELTPPSARRWAKARGFDLDHLRERFGLEVKRTRRGDALWIPTGARARIRYCDGHAPKTIWARGKSGTDVVYGLASCAADGPLYLVNGEPSVWACQLEGVNAVCLCKGESSPPSSIQAAALIATERPIRVVFDVDTAGIDGANCTTAALRAFGASDVAALELPAELGEHGDVEDLWRKVGAQLGTALAELPILHFGPTERAVFCRIEDPVAVLEQASDVLRAYSVAKGVRLYQRGGELVRVIDGQLRPMGRPTLLTELGSAARWHVPSRGGKWRQSLPPDWVVAGVAERGTYPLAELIDVLPHPALLPGPRWIVEPGFVDGYLADFNCRVRLPKTVTRERAQAAAQELLDVVADFPFAATCHRSAWLALVLAGLARPAIAGPCPLWVIDSNVRGSGKTLLARVASWILAGRELPITSSAQTEDEWRKRIFAIAQAGDALAIIDNARGTLISASLEAALTTCLWRDRRLGSPDFITLPCRALWVVTSNNARLGGDLLRRALHVQLRSSLERPELRDGFRHPDLRAHVITHRDQLLAAGLTILKGWVELGGGPPEPSWGSYEDFSRIVRGAIRWLGLADPFAPDSIEDSDLELYRIIVEQWPRDLYGQPDLLAARHIAQRLRVQETEWGAAMAELLPTDPSARQIGCALRRYRDRVVSGRRLVHRWSRGSRGWTVELVELEPEPEP